MAISGHVVLNTSSQWTKDRSVKQQTNQYSPVFPADRRDAPERV